MEAKPKALLYNGKGRGSQGLLKKKIVQNRYFNDNILLPLKPARAGIPCYSSSLQTCNKSIAAVNPADHVLRWLVVYRL